MEIALDLQELVLDLQKFEVPMENNFLGCSATSSLDYCCYCSDDRGGTVSTYQV